MSLFMNKIQTFVQEFILGKERVLDTGELPITIYEAFRQAGLSQWWISHRLGGLSISLEDSVEAVSELAYGDAGLAFAFFCPILTSTAIEIFGSKEHCNEYLHVMAKKGSFGATLASEESSGSELIRLSTIAEQQGGQYIISGNKYFSTNVALAEYYLIYVRMSRQEQDFKAIIVPKNTEGLKIVRRWPVIGLRASGTYEVDLKECKVPIENELSGNGLRILEVSLNASRTLMAASAIGIAKRIRDLCLEYAKSKPLKGSVLLANDVFAAKLGAMEAQIDTMISICKTAAREFDSIMTCPTPSETFLTKGVLKSVIVAKIMCGKLGWEIASVASEMFGGLGYTEESLIGKLVRDMRYVSIVEAGNDVLYSLLYSRYVRWGN